MSWKKSRYKKKKSTLAGFLPLIVIAGVYAFTSFLEKKSSTPPTYSFTMPWPTPLSSEEENSISENLTQKNYYIILDGSGSMRERRCSGNQTKEEVAKEAVADFTTKIEASANIGLLIFDRYGTSERVPLGVDNREQIMQALGKSSALEGTPLHSAIRLGIGKLGSQARKQLGYGEYHLVIVTDGEASNQEDPSAVVNFAYTKTPVNIHTVGFCIELDHSLNQEGKTFYKSAKDRSSLNKGLEDVLAEAEEFNIDDFENL